MMPVTRLLLRRRGGNGLSTSSRLRITNTGQRTMTTTTTSRTTTKRRPQTLIEKIVQRHALGQDAGFRGSLTVHAGDIVSIRPKHVLTHDNTWAVMAKFASLNDESSSSPSISGSIVDPRQPVLALDHNVQDRSAENLARYAAIEQFAMQHHLDFFPAGRGIGHQVMVEEGYVQPGWLVVASDSHSNMYGALGALGTPIVRTDAAAIWATGTTWWQVPPIARVRLSGSLRKAIGVTGKDVILALCGLFAKDQVLNHAVEFVGDGIQCLNMEERLTISNMTTEWGALAGVFPVDEVTVDFLLERAGRLRSRHAASTSSSSSIPPRVLLNERLAHELASAVSGGTESSSSLSNVLLAADPGARYSKTLQLDLSRLRPLVAGPNAIKTIRPVHALVSERKEKDLEEGTAPGRGRIPVHKAYIVSCVNSRVGDLAAAAAVLKGKKVARHVELYIAAASSEVEAESRARGDWQALVDAGAIELPSGCGPCVGLGRGLLRDGEVAISATNRNFKGRMGSRNAQAYLASPTVVATSALHGYIVGPPLPEGEEEAEKKAVGDEEWDMEMGSVAKEEMVPMDEEEGDIDAAAEMPTTMTIDGFPSSLKGDILLVPRSNIDTDGIYAGRHCYEDLDAQQQAQVVMENYDPAFASLVRKGDVLVAGSNFGCGSSREQAATALRASGVQAIVAASANETFRRNALNNALLVLEIPALVATLKQWACGNERGQMTTLTSRLMGVQVALDFTRSRATVVFNNGGDRKGMMKTEFPFTPVGTVAQEILIAGGLENWVKMQRQQRKHQSETSSNMAAGSVMMPSSTSSPFPPTSLCKD